MKKRLFNLTLLALVSLFILSACSSDEESDTFKVGLEAGYAPFNWTQADDSNPKFMVPHY